MGWKPSRKRLCANIRFGVASLNISAQITWIVEDDGENRKTRKVSVLLTIYFVKRGGNLGGNAVFPSLCFCAGTFYFCKQKG